MDERQALATIRNVLRLENLASDVVATLTPELRAIFKEVGGLMRNMPEGEIARQMAYRQMQQRLASLFQPVHRQLYDELIEKLGREYAYQVHWAQAYLNQVEKTPKQMAAAAAPPVGVSVPVPIDRPFLGPGNWGLGGEFTREQLNAVARETSVLGKTLSQLFDLEDFADSPVFLSWLKNVDRVVKTGFLTGMTNEEIAKALRKAEKMSIAQARAIARTAVMDMSHRAHDAFWDANDDVIVAWEFDASLDYRVCPQCAPWDGVSKKRREDLPTVPVHPNCRCQVLPITQAEALLRKEDHQNDDGPDQTYIELVPGRKNVNGRWVNIERPPNKKDERYYAKPVYVDGERYWRRVRTSPAKEGRPMSMADFLRKANNLTQEKVMGVSRAKLFRERLAMKGPKGKPIYTTQQALLSVMPRSK